MMMRRLILSISKWLAIIFLVCAILMFFMQEFQTLSLVIKITILGFGLFFTLINWFYDDLIFYFSPEDMELTLYR